MENKIPLLELSENIALRLGVSKKKAEMMTRAFFDTIEVGLIKDNFVKIKRFGTFKLVNVSERESVNINTGERIQITGHSKVTFSPDNELKELVNRPFSHFQTVTLNDNTPIYKLENLDTVDDELEEFVENSVDNDIPKDHIREEKAEVKNHTKEPAQTLSVAERNEEEVCQEESGVQNQEMPDQEAEVQKQEQNTQDLNYNKSLEIEPESETTVPKDLDTDDDVAVETENISKNRSINAIGLVILVIVLICCSYFAGYYRWLCPCDKETKATVTPKQEYIVKDTINKTLVPNDSTKVLETEKAKADSLARQANEDVLENSKKYAQIPNARYIIIGELEAHRMKRGESLYAIAKKTYGNKDFARYIIFYNNISNPDIVPEGKLLKMPKLIRKP